MQQRLFVRLSYVVGVCAIVSSLLGATPLAEAHAGGHPVAPGDTLRMWTDPVSGHSMPASLLYVSNGLVHVEDAGGLVHTWALSALRADDRIETETWRRRIEELNRPPVPPVAPGRAPDPVPAPSPTLLLILGLAIAGPWLLRRASASAATRAAVVVAAIAIPVACGSGTGASTPTSPSTGGVAPASGDAITLPLASYFTAFPAHVRTRQDAQNLYVESDGMADHTLMVGIRSWQQQVPLPQPYTGTNAFTIPLTARLAAQPVSARTALFNGAIALAVNGVPIFNALNNRGDDAFLAGELDEFGGHSGRADDYHYHVAPFVLQETVGPTRPLAVALDGFPLYGSVEPDGSAMRPLDAWNGHSDATTLYHYHGTRTYPYINGGMRGVVAVSNDHVDPQPTLRPARPAGTPLSGATIVGFVPLGNNAWRLEYRLNGGTYRVEYRVDGTTYTYVFIDPAGVARTETYAAR